MNKRFLTAFILLSASRLFADDAWRPLWNGRDLSGWTTWLATPDPTCDVPGMSRGADGKYHQPIGANQDPLSVFTVVPDVDGRPAIRISGQVFGELRTTESFENYRLRLQFKWGRKVWPPRLKARRDSGLLYHVHAAPGTDGKVWARSFEFQIQEHDVGDLYAIRSRITVHSKPFADGLHYDPAGPGHSFTQDNGDPGRCIKEPDNENPTGEWNSLELVCLGDHSIHVVNGRVVMRLDNPLRLDTPQPVPVMSGPVMLQSEGAEVFYRNIEIEPISELPREYLEPMSPPQAESTEVWAPEPKVVEAAGSFTAAPADALVLFDGRDLSQWVLTKDRSLPATWDLKDGVMVVNKKSGNIETRRLFRNYQLHLEYRIPPEITGWGQGRGNSGLFLASTGNGDRGYELQILDSYHNKTYVNGMAGSVYKQFPPLVNACRPPGEWQSYDIRWTAPAFNTDGSLKSPARLTAIHNGVVIQNDTVLRGETVYRGIPAYSAYDRAPIKLQGHGDPSPPISFRNIWVRDLPD